MKCKKCTFNNFQFFAYLVSSLTLIILCRIFFFKPAENYFSLSAALLIVYEVENQYSIWQMKALWSGCQDSVTLLSVIRGTCLLEGRGLQSSSLIHSSSSSRPTGATTPFSTTSLSSPPSTRCTSAPTASSPTQTWIVSECTWWRSTLSSPCYAAHYARTCSTTRSTCSSTSHTSTVWRLTVSISWLPQ